MTRGISLRGPHDSLAEQAQQAEKRGFDAVWVTESRHESIIQACLVALATSRIGVGTDITLAFPRSPTITAMQAWDLDRITGGRFTIGLGSQVRRIIEERFSAEFSSPANRMAEYIQAMRTVWRLERGEGSSFDGEFYRVLRPGIAGPGQEKDRTLPPIYLAAVGPLMTKVAATHADGLLGHPFTSDRYITDTVWPRVAEGMSAAGRPEGSVALCQAVITSVDDDRERAMREAKQQIGFYGTTPNYRAVFASYGEEELTDRLREAWKSSHGAPEALADVIPDASVEHYAAVGTPEEVRDRLAEFEAHVDQVIVGSPWYGIDPVRIEENTAALIETLGTS